MSVQHHKAREWSLHKAFASHLCFFFLLSHCNGSASLRVWSKGVQSIAALYAETHSLEAQCCVRKKNYTTVTLLGSICQTRALDCFEYQYSVYTFSLTTADRFLHLNTWAWCHCSICHDSKARLRGMAASVESYCLVQKGLVNPLTSVPDTVLYSVILRWPGLEAMLPGGRDEDLLKSFAMIMLPPPSRSLLLLLPVLCMLWERLRLVCVLRRDQRKKLPDVPVLLVEAVTCEYLSRARVRISLFMTMDSMNMHTPWRVVQIANRKLKTVCVLPSVGNARKPNSQTSDSWVKIVKAILAWARDLMALKCAVKQKK